MKLRTWPLAVLPLLFYGALVARYVQRHRLDDLLWPCNVAQVFLIFGCAFRTPRLVAIATTWLTTGLPLWLLTVLMEKDLPITSILTHVGGLTVGVIAAWRLHWPRHTWRWVVACHVLLLVASRLLTNPEHNVNLAFAVQTGWERLFTSHPLYLVMMTALMSAGAFATERAAFYIFDIRNPRHKHAQGRS